MPCEFSPRMLASCRGCVTALALLLATFAGAAAAQPPTSPPPSGAPQTQAAQEKQPGISASEREELLRSVDTILEFVSRRTKLPVLYPVKRELASREQLKEFLGLRLQEDENAQRLRRSEVVLKKFGLLPRTFDLSPFLVELLQEQVAGYYDPKTKTVHLLDWIEPDAQKPVLAHELTHALLDQHFDLVQWLDPKGSRPAGSKANNEDGEPDLELDDDSSARHALAEGQAMAVFLEYILEPFGRSLRDDPELTARFRESILEMGSQFPLFGRAPLMLQESLNFPYSYGLEFVRQALEKGGEELAYAGVMRAPPRTTRDIMMPEKFFGGESIPPLRLPKLRAALRGAYTPYDAGTLGQFDVQVMVKQFRDQAAADELAPHWRGGAYYAAVRRQEKREGPPAVTSLGLVFAIRWSGADAARQMADIYAESLGAKYTSLKATKAAEPGARRWDSEEGPIFIETHGDLLLVLEGLDAQTAGRVRKAVRASQQLSPGPPRKN